MKGSQSVRFVELVRDTMREHGVAWAVRYYAKRLPRWELRFWMARAVEGL